MAVPVARTWADRDPLTTTNLNTGVRDAAAYLLADRPLLQLRQAAVQSIPNNAWTALTFTAEDVDTHNGHSTSSNTDQYVIQEDCWAWLDGSAAFASNATGARGTRWKKNGAAQNASQILLPAVNGQNTSIPARGMCLSCLAGDAIQLECWQNSGGALNTIVSGEAASGMTIVFLRKP